MMSSKSQSLSYTVLIPVSPNEPFLAAAIESVLAQTSPPEAIFICLNGTSDTDCLSSRISNDFGPPVSLLMSTEPGQAVGLNRGLGEAQTPYVAFLDADDLWSPRKQELQMQIFADNPEIDAVYGQVSNFQEDAAGGRHIGITAPAKTLTSTSFKRSCFSRFGKFNEASSHFVMHYEWWGRATDGGIQAERIYDTVLLRRIHSGNSWVTRKEEGLRELFSHLRLASRAKEDPESSSHAGKQ